MKRPALLLAFLLGAGTLRAEGESYQANPGLIRTGGFTVFYNAQGPLSFETLTPGEIPHDAVEMGEVKCRSCQHGLSIPLFSTYRRSSVSGAVGDGGYKKIIALIQKDRPDLRGIYDVKIDLHKISILGVYRKVCTEITARGFK